MIFSSPKFPTYYIYIYIYINIYVHVYIYIYMYISLNNVTLGSYLFFLTTDKGDSRSKIGGPSLGVYCRPPDSRPPDSRPPD